MLLPASESDVHPSHGSIGLLLSRGMGILEVLEALYGEFGLSKTEESIESRSDMINAVTLSSFPHGPGGRRTSGRLVDFFRFLAGV
jgi:hypothetical protein